MPNAKMAHFSIVVPTYNRPKQLEDLLLSLTRLDYPSAQFEVIVVDDGSSIPLAPAISKFQRDLDLTLHRQDNKGPSAARNNGAIKAEGKFLVFTDDDCQPDSNWLQALAEAFDKSPSCLCGGAVINALKRNRYSASNQLLVDYLYENYNPTARPDGFFTANNFAVPKNIFFEIGGFDPTLRFGEDRDFCYRWASRGYPFFYAQEAAVYHWHALNLFSFLQLHFSYGRGTYQFWKRCSAGGLNFTRLKPPTWYANLLLAGVRKEKSPGGLLNSLLLLTIQGACTAGVLLEAAKHARLLRA